MDIVMKMWKYKDFFLEGIMYTIILSVLGIIFGSIGGTLISLMRISSNKILRTIAKVYVDIIRGTPILLQLWMVFLLIDSDKLVAGFVALSINSSAYVAEIIRSGINSIPKGQTEAARSLGMSKSMAMRYIVFPQAIKNIVPVLGNEFIAIVKESSIVSVIGVMELTYSSKQVQSNTYTGMPALVVGAAFYFIITKVLSKFVNRAERRLGKSDTDK